MIIDDAHQMAFIHIPKCGGTSVRTQLAAFDSTGGAFYPVIEHPVLGRIHTSHLPLEFVAAHFPDAFAKIGQYRSFALIREPMSRFASAAFQRLKGFRRIPPADITTAMALAEAEAVMDWLRGRGSFCDFDYIHFARQTGYVRLDGRPIVRHLFALEDMAGFAEALRAICGINLDPERRENTNFASADPVSRGVRRLLKPVYSRLTTWEFRQRLMLRMKQAGKSEDEPLYQAFRTDKRIRAFVEDHYTDDFELHAALRPSRPQGAAAVRAGAASPPALSRSTSRTSAS